MFSSEQVIKRLRKMQGSRTAKELAVELDISEPYLSDIFKGNREPGPKVLEKIGLKRKTMYEAA